MKERIENKLEEIIEIILEKDNRDITNDEFNILKNKISEIKFEENKEERNKELSQIIAAAFKS